MINIHKENSQDLYEDNFLRIRTLLPDLQLFEHVTLSSEDHYVQLCVDVLERTPYTMLLSFVSRYGEQYQHVPETKIQVRMYYDAQVAEVLTVQGHRHIRPHYKYPNTKMYTPDEKKQGNHLLTEMLVFCVKNNYKKSYLDQPFVVNN